MKYPQLPANSGAVTESALNAPKKFIKRKIIIKQIDRRKMNDEKQIKKDEKKDLEVFGDFIDGSFNGGDGVIDELREVR